LRSGSSAEVKIINTEGTLVGTVDESRAPRLVHEGAVYLHRGQTYKVEHFDPDDLVAVVDVATDDEYTQPRTSTDISVIAIDDKQAVGPMELLLGVHD